MQKDYNKHETNWDNAIFVTWELEAKNFHGAEALAAFIETFHKENYDGAMRSDYREVWQRDNDFFVVVSWFKNKDGPLVWEHFDISKKHFAEKGIFMCQMKQGYGKYYSIEGACFKNCVKVLEEVDGNLVAVRKLRKALSKIQGINGYALDHEEDEEDEDDETILAAE